ncbi:MAG: GtrA family protein [Sterolibacterium sp.]|nr:GtrA family protein [Sterolibacterium sp.]
MLEYLRQLIRFAGVGLMSAVGHFGLLILLVQGPGMGPVPASAAGALLGAWINYSLNYRYTFRSAKKHQETVLRFAVVAAIGLLLNTLFMWLCIDLLGIYYLLAQLLTTGMVFIWSFLASRYWTFQVKPTPR